MSDIKVAVVTAEKEIASLFIGDVCGAPGLEGEVTLGGRSIKLEASLVQPDTGFDGPGAPLADAYIMIAHFLDAVSLDVLKFAYETINTRPRIRQAVILYRKNGESEYKISCSACGQKLLIRDTHVGQIGRCPHCKESSRLPLPDVLMSHAMGISQSANIRKISGKTPEHARELVSSLAQQVTGYDQALKSSTMRIEIPK